MKRTDTAAFDRAAEILNGLRKGAVLLSCADGTPNAMTISWGTLGREWEREIFTVFVRETRYTHELLDANSEFAVQVPLQGFDRRLLARFGTTSGRDGGKFDGVATVAGEKVGVPVLDAPSIVLECKVLWRRDQRIGEEEGAFEAYTRDANGEYVGPNHDTIYCGQIVGCYVLG
jgi:hypothetical protein